jgi:group I intron endonuclease
METNYIYKITNKVNGKVYIGKSKNPEKRWNEHKREARNNGSSHLYNTMRKIGIENFNFIIIEECGENWQEREIYYINKYNSIKPNGYNLAPGGESGPGLKGFDNPKSKLNQEQILEIIDKLKNSNVHSYEIAKQYNVNRGIVEFINAGKSYFFIEGEKYPIRPLTLEYKVKDIIETIKYTKDIFEIIAKKFDVNKEFVRKVNSGELYPQNGEEYPIRKRFLTLEQIQEITYALTNTDILQASIAYDYDTTKNTISKINLGKAYYRPELSYPLRKR